MNLIQINGYPNYKIAENGSIVGARGWLLKYDVNSVGYYRVTLSSKGEAKRFFVHRLVAEHFCVNPHGLPSVNHKDGNRKNNHKDNLEWCTNSYNVKDGFLRGRRAANRVPEWLERAIWEEYSIIGNKTAVASTFGLSVDTVHRVISDGQFVEM